METISRRTDIGRNREPSDSHGTVPTPRGNPWVDQGRRDRPWPAHRAPDRGEAPTELVEGVPLVTRRGERWDERRADGRGGRHGERHVEGNRTRHDDGRDVGAWDAPDDEPWDDRWDEQWDEGADDWDEGPEQDEEPEVLDLPDVRDAREVGGAAEPAAPDAVAATEAGPAAPGATETEAAPEVSTTSHRRRARAAGVGRVVAAAGPHRRRAVPKRSRFRRLGWILLGLTVLAAAAVLALLFVPQLPRAASPAPTPVPVAAPAAEVAFGEEVRRPDGWTVEIDEPVAYDRDEHADVDLPASASRAVVVEVVLTNSGTEARDSAGWTVKAVVGNTPVEVLPDAEVPSRTVRPGASLAFEVTVPMPRTRTDLQLEAAPAGGAPSLFVGTA